jgi:peptidoglycan/xylan/chitin deacetylase (PgdA/CDA1 family)
MASSANSLPTFVLPNATRTPREWTQIAKRLLDRSLTRASEEIGRGLSKVLPDKPGLLTFSFHSLFADAGELQRHIVHPQQAVTLAHFREFVEYFLGHGYSFVNPDDILKGLSEERRYAMITFDDGYYNNVRALPFLREYRVPAVFFITAGHVAENRPFWWDVLYRERMKDGVSSSRIAAEEKMLKARTHDEVERYLAAQLGAHKLHPVGDLDRPFTPSELRDFSREPFVAIGNHTRDHAVLTNYPAEEAFEQIVSAQSLLREMSGIAPVSICYPNGSYSAEVVHLAKAAGLQVGIACDPHKNQLPLDPQSAAVMCLGRFTIQGNDRVTRQCEILRTESHIYPRLKHRFRSGR